MGRKSKFQLHLLHPDFEDHSKKEIESIQQVSHKSQRNRNPNGTNRKPLKHALKEDPRDFYPIELTSFLYDNPLEYFSAEKITYNLLIRKEETAQLLKGYQKNLHEKQEETRIKNATTSDELFQILIVKPSPNNVELLISKMLHLESELVPRILSLLGQEIDEMILEFIIDFLYQTKKRWIKEIENTLANITIPYAISLLSVILGLVGNKDQIPLLWKAYHILDENGSYTQGPLLGLSLIWDKEHGIPID